MREVTQISGNTPGISLIGGNSGTAVQANPKPMAIPGAGKSVYSPRNAVAPKTDYTKTIVFVIVALLALGGTWYYLYKMKK